MTPSTASIATRPRQDEYSTAFPQRDFRQRLRDYVAALTRELDKLEGDANWTDDSLVRLNAEVEVHRVNRRTRRQRDLLRAIRGDRRSRLLLVLGDPGSGKSVALRWLCRDLLAKASTTRMLPLYVNLREWTRERPWTENSPPTAADLYEFILSNLKGRADVLGADFLDDCFKPMLDRGMIFLILDSFDEIPAVLDAEEDSWLIDALSNAIDGFLRGAHGSRGLVASRRYRRPTAKLSADVVLEVRPLSERQVARLIGRALSGVGSGETVRRLFHERRELVPIARNPFTASLITAYAREHEGALPQNQAELYESYTNRRLRDYDERLRRLGLTAGEVLETARDVAAYMFTADQLGLEAPVERLAAEIPGRRMESVLELLAFIRLGRLSGTERNFGFVHRRFAEYFVVQWMRQDPSRAPEEAIPTDSRFRDALALYCEVAAEEDATRFAIHAAVQVERGGLTQAATSTDEYRAAVHSLRFVADAFRGRPECIAPIRERLSALILDVLRRKESGLVSKKLSVEVVGLLDQESMRKCLLAAVQLKNSWIDETVFRSCQSLTKADASLNAELCASINRIPWYRFVARSRDLLFALSLTEAFSRTRWFCKLRLVNLGALAVAVALLLVLYPAVFIVAAALVMFLEILYMTTVISYTDRAFYYAILILMGGLVASGAFSSETRDVPALIKSIAIAIAGCAVLLPFHEVLRLHRGSMNALRKDLVGVIVAVVLLWLLWCLLVLLSKVSSPQLILGGVGFAMAVTLLRGCWHGLVWLAAAARDFRTMWRLGIPVQEMSRTQIARMWQEMHTARGRSAYVRWLREHRVSATGPWPDHRLPHDDGEAGTLLAQMEEGWLGLSR
jgi:hypothetical protein